MAAVQIPFTTATFLSSSIKPIFPIPSSFPISFSSTSPIPQSLSTQNDQQRHKTQLVESFHYNNRLRNLIEALSNKRSDPLRILHRDGDWTRDQLWAALVFLLEHSRTQQALQVYDCWKNKEASRISTINYSKIIRLLCERNLMKEAALTLDDMESHGLSPSVAIYNDIIHGFAREKEFNKSRAALDKMVETGLLPTPETYNGLIRAYGSYGLYDEMCKCVKKMESEGCFPNEVTYNLLIAEFARAGLLERMERVYRTLFSKKMNLQPHTLVTMLEAYADLKILDKMEKVYHHVLKSKAFMKESLSRKMAIVYIENSRFTRLEEFGNDLGAKYGRTDLVWCILLLSSACLMSRKGVESIVREMEIAKVELNINFTNILGLFYLKLKDFKALDSAFSQIGTHCSKPDMVTFGILFDACKIGYSGTRSIDVWKRNGYLENLVEMNTDPLVMAAFGKGYFIRTCEKLYSLRSGVKDKESWTYGDLINLVFGSN